MYSVFISHRGCEIDLAERLALDLKRKGGHQVWFDAWNIKVGETIVGRINEGLSGEVALVLCLSKLGLSDWMNTEWMSTLARQLNGENVRLLPAKLTGGSLPAVLADRKCTDLSVRWD